jgi:hypothetical protein
LKFEIRILITHEPLHLDKWNLKFRIVFWDVLPCKVIVYRRIRGTCFLHHQRWLDNYFTRQYIPEDISEPHTHRRENLKSHKWNLV